MLLVEGSDISSSFFKCSLVFMVEMIKMSKIGFKTKGWREAGGGINESKVALSY